VAMVVALQFVVSRCVTRRGHRVTCATACGTGAVAAFWTNERGVGFWG